MTSKSKAAKPGQPVSERGLDEYRRLMVEFEAQTGYIYFLNGRCRVPKATTPAGILQEIDDVIRGFINGPATNYTLWRQQLRDALRELDLIDKLAGEKKAAA